MLELWAVAVKETRRVTTDDWSATGDIAPGFVRSNPNTEKQWESYGPEGQAELVESIAMRRLGTPRDIANAVLFFASQEAGWITGQVLSVDGGR